MGGNVNIDKVSLGDISNDYSTVILIDLSWVLHRSYHAFKGFSVSPVEGTSIPTGHIYGVLSTVQSFLSLGDTIVIICRDGHPVSRIEESEASGIEYKAGRPELEYDFYKDVPKIVRVASKHSNVYYAYNQDKEADDIMYALSRRFVELGKEVIIHSGDNDLLQSITKDNKVRIVRKFDNGKPIFIDFDTVGTDEAFTKKFYGVYPDKLPLFRSVVGDSSDNIRGIPRFNRKALVDIVNACDSLDMLFRVAGKYGSILRENEQLVRTNYNLMKLRDDFVVNVVKVTVNDDLYMRDVNYYQLNKWKNFISRRI